jgi:hypothetical protein
VLKENRLVPTEAHRKMTRHLDCSLTRGDEGIRYRDATGLIEWGLEKGTALRGSGQTYSTLDTINRARANG